MVYKGNSAETKKLRRLESDQFAGTRRVVLDRFFESLQTDQTLSV
jgi:hypothetical protein